MIQTPSVLPAMIVRVVVVVVVVIAGVLAVIVLAGQTKGVHNAVCNTHRTSVNCVGRGVCSLPKDLPSGDIQSAPCTPGYLLSRRHQGVGEVVAIRDSNINALTIGRGTPLDASERSAWTYRCAPNDVAVIGIECPEDAALLAKANDIAHEIRS